MAAPLLPDDPDIALAVATVPPDARGGVAALFALDARLGGILRRTTEPLVGQMRLTWWHEALRALDRATPPAEPVLEAVHGGLVVPGHATGAALAAMIDGWEELLGGEPAEVTALRRYAAARGGTLFATAGVVIGVEDPCLRSAGQGWALVDLARNSGDRLLSAAALEAAEAPLVQAFTRRWPRPLRTLGALAKLAEHDRRRGPDVSRERGGPARGWCVVRHRLSGR